MVEESVSCTYVSSSRFSMNSEADASELIKNIENIEELFHRYYM